ncbi:unnamed protein product, partial [Polarella glacialis]
MEEEVAAADVASVEALPVELLTVVPCVGAVVSYGLCCTVDSPDYAIRAYLLPTGIVEQLMTNEPGELIDVELSVAIPHAVWNRDAKKRRKLSPQLPRLIALEVFLRGKEDTGAATPAKTKIGMEVLTIKAERQLFVPFAVDSLGVQIAPTVLVEGVRFPSSKVLYDAVTEYYMIVSAPSESGKELGVITPPGVEDRLGQLEGILESIQDALVNLIADQANPPGDAAWMPAKAAEAELARLARKADAAAVHGLAPGPVRACRASGSNEAPMETVPAPLEEASIRPVEQPSTRARSEPLIASEAEDEEDAEDEDELLTLKPVTSGGLEKAISQLMKLLAILTPKKEAGASAKTVAPDVNGAPIVHDLSPAVEEVKVPGGAAQSYLARRLWLRQLRDLLKMKGNLSEFARSVLSTTRTSHQTPSEKDGTIAVWPMPPPYPECWRRSEERIVDRAFKTFVNLLVVVFSWLHLRRPRFAPPAARMGAPLSSSQQQAVGRLESLAAAWNVSHFVEPSDTGRSALKVEGLEAVLQTLHLKASSLRTDLAKYSPSVRAGSNAEALPGFDSRDQATVEIGHVSKGSLQMAKEVDPSRPNFGGTPDFDPVPLLSATTAARYIAPLDHRLPVPKGPMPKVKVRASRARQLQLFEKLDSTGRLAIFAYENRDDVSGLFALVKDLLKDRMILDARLASAASLLQIYLEPGRDLYFSGDDLKDYYYYFCVSLQRALRNRLSGSWRPSELQHLRCFKPELWSHPALCEALAAMAMGDLNAVEVGQAAHVALAARASVMKQSEFLTMSGRGPRRAAADFIAGVIIDDFVALSQRVKSELLISDVLRMQDEAARSLVSSRMALLRGAYHQHGLVRNANKAFVEQTKAAFWGAECDGVSGLVRPPLVRVIPLASLTRQVAALGVCTAGLLEILAGCWTSVFQFRRRLMSLLDLIFAAQRGRTRTTVLRMSAELRTELFVLSMMGPIAVTNLRSSPAPWIDAADASNWGEAVVRAPLPTPIALELRRHSLIKGAWAKLLAPSLAWARSHGKLRPDQELPEGLELEESPIWVSLAQSLQYKEIWRSKSASRRHINIGEVRAYLKAEAIAAEERPVSQTLIGSDSQVTLGAVTKGRGSSPSLNVELSSSVPTVIAAEIYSVGGFLLTAVNPADDPTRDRPVRDPTHRLPAWWGAAAQGSFELLDASLVRCGLDPDVLSGAPLLETALEKVQIEGLKPRLAKSAAYLKGEHWRPSGADVGAGAVRPLLGSFLPRYPTGNPADAGGCAPLGGAASGAQVLSQTAIALLATLPESRFLHPGRRDPHWRPTTPGFLDLYSGQRGVAKALRMKGAPWVLTFDFLDGPDQDLLDPETRVFLQTCVDAGAFSGIGAAPICASFSSAVAPPVRTPAYPRGVPWMTSAMKVKVRDGNSHSRWLCSLLLRAHRLGIPFWVENPDGSWLWRQREWQRLAKRLGVGLFRLDFCRFGTRWRKRTRILTTTELRDNTLLRGQDATARCCQHLVLRGRCAARNLSWAKVAEPYPAGLCQVLAAALLNAAGLQPERRRLDIVSCARACFVAGRLALIDQEFLQRLSRFMVTFMTPSLILSALGSRLTFERLMVVWPLLFWSSLQLAVGWLISLLVLGVRRADPWASSQPLTRLLQLSITFQNIG